MLIFILSEIKDAKQALEVAEDLVTEAIEAANSLKGKRKKIRSVESKMKMLISLCRAKKAQGQKGWTAPVKCMKQSIQVLEDARAESDASLWSI